MLKKIIIFIMLFKVAVLSSATFQDFKKELENKYKNVNQYQFWINHSTNLDKIILNKEQIDKLNSQIAMFADSTNNIFSDFSKELIKDKILKMANYLFKNYRFFANGKLLGKNFKNKIYKEININGISKCYKKKYFGVIRKRCFVKSIPTDLKIIRDINSKNFDRNIETISHIFDLVKVLNISKDRKWLYVASKYYYGWIKKEDLIIRETPFKFKKFVVILKNLQEYNLRVGDILPYNDKKIYLFGKKVRIKKDDFNVGYLPFTKRNVIKLIFSSLKMPYNWGGGVYGTDCSLFIMDIFRCFGINLPRNSWKQSEVLAGLSLMHVNKKEKFIKKFAFPFQTLIYKKSHIMLYMGSVGNKVYIAHAFTMKKFQQGEVLITDLYFGREHFADSLKKIVFFNQY